MAGSVSYAATSMGLSTFAELWRGEVLENINSIDTMRLSNDYDETSYSKTLKTDLQKLSDKSSPHQS